MKTDEIVIYIIIIIIILILFFVYYSEFYFAKPVVIMILSNFDKGNFIFIDQNNNEIIRVINDSNKEIPIIKIYNDNNFFTSIYNKSECGLGESYMRGEWKCDKLIDFLNTLCLNMNNPNIPKIQLSNILSTSISYDKSNIKHHYDIGNDFYLQFLRDDLNAYSCGFWFNDNDDLNKAQYNKVNTILKKLQVKSGSSVLDIGCGWGTIANYIAHMTNSRITGITISDEQEKYGIDNYDFNKVKIFNMDYRYLSEQFDYIYSIGMFEHVRYENYDTFFKIIKKCLKPGGRFVLHTIISYDNTRKTCEEGDNFVTTHIFPGGQIPHNDWILNKARDNGLNIIHFEGFGGQHYAKTLKTWRELMWSEKNYISSKYSNELLLKYDYYFSICEAGFNTGLLGIGHYVIVSEPILSLTNSFNY